MYTNKTFHYDITNGAWKTGSQHVLMHYLAIKERRMKGLVFTAICTVLRKNCCRIILKFGFRSQLINFLKNG